MDPDGRRTIVVALGGNALLQRGEAPTLEAQRRRVDAAARVLAPLAERHRVVLTHGNGPQVGLLAIQAAAAAGEIPPYGLDVLGAESEGLIGYLLETALRNAVRSLEVATLLTQVVVDAGDPAFGRPTKPIGPVHPTAAAAGPPGAVVADGGGYRRVVASPRPVRVVELAAIRHLLDAGMLVIAVGGGGIPVVEDPVSGLAGVEAVIDKDLASALLAIELDADELLLLTDVDGVHQDHGTPAARTIRSASPSALAALELPDGTMGPKVQAVCWFVEATGGRAAIGALDHVEDLISGTAGTEVSVGSEGVRWWPSE